MKINYEDIFEHIGFLAYSIAQPAGPISELRIEKLKGIVDLVWKENDTVTMHLNDCIMSGITFCIDNSMTPEHAFSSFENYFEIHRAPFGEQLRKKIVSLSQGIFGEFQSPDGAVRVERVIQLMELQKQASLT